MPFIFHSEKKSPFSREVEEIKKLRELTPNTVRKIMYVMQKDKRASSKYLVNINVCKDHPFRQHKQPI
jgi:hypothetical protein